MLRSGMLGRCGTAEGPSRRLSVDSGVRRADDGRSMGIAKRYFPKTCSGSSHPSWNGLLALRLKRRAVLGSSPSPQGPCSSRRHVARDDEKIRFCTQRAAGTRDGRWQVAWDGLDRCAFPRKESHRTGCVCCCPSASRVCELVPRARNGLWGFWSASVVLQGNQCICTEYASREGICRKCSWRSRRRG